MFRTTPRSAFITLKDHKPDFSTRPAVRLINPTKNEMGQVAMQILDKIVKEIRNKTNLKQCTNTREVINWFKNLKNKQGLKFIVYDIDSFYASITPKLLDETLEWASTLVAITPLQKKIIHQACESFLYHEGIPWVKRGEKNFDVGMGAFHGAQVCEVIGLFILSKLEALPNFDTILYRDDGLAVTSSTPRQQEKLRQKIIQIFGKHDMKITIEINLKRVDYLDVTLDLETGLFKPYRKPGDKPLYVSAQSNHPPQVLKNIPKGIERRLSDNSANEEIFRGTIPPYQAELERCGFAHKLEYKPGNKDTANKKRARSRKVTWFNPPYSMDVGTNVGKVFLNLLDQHFPPGHVLHSVMNRSTVKVSYRCLPNMGAQVAKQNAKNMQNTDRERANPPPKCNCQRNLQPSCPIPGACNQKGVIYQATVASNGGEEESYIGLASNFKKRFYKHKDSLQVKNPQTSTTLSTHFWIKDENGENPVVSWKILESNIHTFNPVTKSCKLCLREKFNIVLNPHLATLNSRHEIFAHCRHMGSKLIDKKPD